MAKFNNDLAPFFDERAVINGQSVAVCAYPPSKADPLVDATLDVNAIVMDMLVRRVGPGAWNDPGNPPKVGQAVEMGGETFAIMTVDVFDTNYFTLKLKRT